MGNPKALMTSLTKQTINTGATTIFDDPHLTVRQLASLIDISIRRTHTFLSTEVGLPCACAPRISHLLLGKVIYNVIHTTNSTLLIPWFRHITLHSQR